MSWNKQELLNFVKGRLDSDDIQPETELFSTGLLDSVSQLDLIIYIEGESGFTIDPADVSLENFDTVDRIDSFVVSRS